MSNDYLDKLDKKVYTPDEMLVSDYLQRITKGLIGSGLDPIQFLICSHEAQMKRIELIEKELSYQKGLVCGLKEAIDKLTKII